MTSDERTGAALEAFCRRYVEGSTLEPTGARWEELPDPVKLRFRETFVGPVHAALQAVEEMK